MLSSHALSSIDGVPLPPAVPSPVQGLDQLHMESQPRSVEPLSIHIPVTAATDAHISETPSTHTSTNLARPSGGLRRYDSFRSIETASPMPQSPLRNSISFTDLTNLDASATEHYATREFQEPQESLKSVPNSPDMAFTGDKVSSSVEDTKRNNRRFSGWFGRGANSEAETSPCPSIHSSKSVKAATSTPKVSPSTNNRRFSFFGNPVTALKPNAPAPVYEDDELATLDIPSALFPGGQAEDGAAFSPAAFKNLQMVATGLLMRYQVAYQQRTTEIRDLKAEQEVQAEEQGEMETRVQHLKMQLEEMGRKVAEREQNIQALLEELTHEKKSNMEERMARTKRPPPSDVSTISEDLGVEEDQRRHGRRSSAETTKSDSSLDTDEESVEEASIFSRSRSPTIATSIPEADQATPMPKQFILGSQKQTRGGNAQFAFGKLFKGAAGDPSVVGCHKCQETGLAWETVNVLKGENKGLKNRVEELESAVETALDAVNGLMIL